MRDHTISPYLLFARLTPQVDLMPGGVQPFCLVMDIYSANPAHKKPIFGNVGSGTNAITVRDNQTVLEFILAPSGGGLPGQSISGVTPQVWHRIGVRYTGSEMGCYLNGTSSERTVSGFTFDPPSGPLVFGHFFSSRRPQARYRNAALWTNRALPVTAMEALTAGHAHPLAYGPDHYWPLDNTVNDLVGGNPLIPGSGVEWDALAPPPPIVPLPIAPLAWVFKPPQLLDAVVAFALRSGVALTRTAEVGAAITEAVALADAHGGAKETGAAIIEAVTATFSALGQKALDADMVAAFTVAHVCGASADFEVSIEIDAAFTVGAIAQMDAQALAAFTVAFTAAGVASITLPPPDHRTITIARDGRTIIVRGS